MSAPNKDAVDLLLAEAERLAKPGSSFETGLSLMMTAAATALATHLAMMPKGLREQTALLLTEMFEHSVHAHLAAISGDFDGMRESMKRLKLVSGIE